MNRLEKFIRNNFNLSQEDLQHLPRIIARCDREIENSETGSLSEDDLYNIVDEFFQIDNEHHLKEKKELKEKMHQNF